MFIPQVRIQKTELVFAEQKNKKDNHDRKIPEFLEGDHTHLKQVLINLTKNALKTTVKGRVTIQAGYDQVNELLVVKIRDTGKGFNTANESRILK